MPILYIPVNRSASSPATTTKEITDADYGGCYELNRGNAAAGPYYR